MNKIVTICGSMKFKDKMMEISKDLNLVDKYDWRRNDFNENIVLTINNINDYFDNRINKVNNYGYVSKK